MTKTCTHIQCDVNAKCLCTYSLCREHFKLLKQSKQLQLQCTPLHDTANQSATTWTRRSVKTQAGGWDKNDSTSSHKNFALRAA